ncbi:MAG TPA: hypothetical protein VNZ52_00260 [Candidatus Thermoplasmatota archaeon]|nr:hypothetical protein [Candidatus Thermoplasmatota archaeon]
MRAVVAILVSLLLLSAAAPTTASGGPTAYSAESPHCASGPVTTDACWSHMTGTVEAVCEWGLCLLLLEGQGTAGTSLPGALSLTVGVRGIFHDGESEVSFRAPLCSTLALAREVGCGYATAIDLPAAPGTCAEFTLHAEAAGNGAAMASVAGSAFRLCLSDAGEPSLTPLWASSPGDADVSFAGALSG